MATLNDPPGGQADLPEIDDYFVDSFDETPPVVAWPGEDAALDNPDQLLTLIIEYFDAGV